MRVIALVLLLSMTLLVLGCGGESGPQATVEKVVPASGTLLYRGKALPHYQVTFTPSDGRRVAIGVTDEAGKFTLGTNDAGDGAPPGTHKVSVVWVGPPPKTDGPDEIIDDPSKMPRPPVNLPANYASADNSGLTQTIPDGGTSELKIDLQ